MSGLIFGGILAYTIGIAAILVAFGIAWWQRREALRTKAALERALRWVTEADSDGLDIFVRTTQQPNVADSGLSKAKVSAIDYADVDCDGEEELLIQYPVGVHGSALKIFGWRDGELYELARLSVGTPAGFQFGDFDGDGMIEIKTQETDWTAGLPYVTAPQIVLLMRWNGTEFKEVSRERLAG